MGPASGAPTPLHTRPPRPGLHGARAPGAPADPMQWGSQGHRRPPADPPTPPRDRHGPLTRMAPPPPRPPAATRAPGPGLSPPAGRAARPPAHGTQGQTPGDRPYIVPAPSTPPTPPLHLGCSNTSSWPVLRPWWRVLGHEKSQNALKMGRFGTNNGSKMGQKRVFPKMILDHL